MARKVTKWTDREVVLNRYPLFFGSDMPKTISAKELIDNAIDQIADKKTKCVNIKISSNSIQVMDGGSGISQSKDKESGKTHLYLAVGELYTSSNYEGVSSTVGANGVGSSATNFLSKKFMAGSVTEGNFKGYVFENGIHQNNGEKFDIIEDETKFPMSNGFYVEAEYNEEILSDPINIEWIIDYVKRRVGELPEWSAVFLENLTNSKNYYFNKIKDHESYIPSWEEEITSLEGVEIVPGFEKGWKFAFAKDENIFNDVKSIVQGAPVQNSKTFRLGFDVEDVKFMIPVPCVFWYSGKKYPKYKDQTKSEVTMFPSDVLSILRKNCPNIFKFYQKKAEEAYLSRTLKTTGEEFFWPAIPDYSSDETELIIAEGYSAVSALKARRDPKYQACLAIRGKILNVWQKDIKDAMKSPVVKEILTIINHYKFDRIIFAVDADNSGSHIATLLLGLFSRFAESYLSEGKIYYCHTPLYVFTDKKGNPIKWSDEADDCPSGLKIDVKKGLGSLTANEVELFVMNKQTRDLWQFEYDTPEAINALSLALESGGKEWIIE